METAGTFFDDVENHMNTKSNTSDHRNHSLTLLSVVLDDFDENDINAANVSNEMNWKEAVKFGKKAAAIFHVYKIC